MRWFRSRSFVPRLIPFSESALGRNQKTTRLGAIKSTYNHFAPRSGLADPSLKSGTYPVESIIEDYCDQGRSRSYANPPGRLRTGPWPADESGQSVLAVVRQEMIREGIRSSQPYAAAKRLQVANPAFDRYRMAGGELADRSLMLAVLRRVVEDKIRATDNSPMLDYPVLWTG